MRAADGMKRCSTCHEIKSIIGHFYKDKSKVDGLTINCRLCRGRPVGWVSKWQLPLEQQPKSRRCPTCGETKPLSTDHYYRSSHNPGGYAGLCRVCVLAASAAKCERQKYSAVPGRPDDKMCFGCGLIKSRLDFGSHASRRDGLTIACRDCTNARHAERRAKYPNERRAIEARYASKYPDAQREKNQTRRARVKRAPSVDLTPAKWQEVLAEFGGRCAYCNVESTGLTQDHVVPLARGGSHTRDNMVPACRSCNARKSDSLLAEWLGFAERDANRPSRSLPAPWVPA